MPDHNTQQQSWTREPFWACRQTPPLSNPLKHRKGVPGAFPPPCADNAIGDEGLEALAAPRLSLWIERNWDGGGLGWGLTIFQILAFECHSLWMGVLASRWTLWAGLFKSHKAPWWRGLVGGSVAGNLWERGGLAQSDGPFLKNAFRPPGPSEETTRMLLCIICFLFSQSCSQFYWLLLIYKYIDVPMLICMLCNRVFLSHQNFCRVYFLTKVCFFLDSVEFHATNGKGLIFFCNFPCVFCVLGGEIFFRPFAASLSF